MYDSVTAPGPFASPASSATSPSEASLALDPGNLEGIRAGFVCEPQAQTALGEPGNADTLQQQDLNLPTELEYRLYELSQANMTRNAPSPLDMQSLLAPDCTNLLVNSSCGSPESSVSIEFGTGDSYWTAVVSRDARAVNLFWYGVTSTKICRSLPTCTGPDSQLSRLIHFVTDCRPTCPSRRPMRVNVIFFTSCQQAERAGYRPCKRCTPNEAFETSVVRQATSTFKAAALIEKCIKAGKKCPTLLQLAEAVGMSPFYLQRTFKKHYGISPKAYAQQLSPKATSTRKS